MRVALTVIAGATLCLVLYAIAAALADSEVLARPATCTATGCFCEADTGVFPDQLLNSLSSFAFVFLGIWALLSTREPVVGTRERIVKPFFAVTMLFLGASSFFYHATLSFLGQFLDIFSMYTYGILLTVGALYRSRRISGLVAIVIWIVASAAFGVLQYEYPDARRVLFVLLLLPGIVLELTPYVTGQSPRSPKVRNIYIGVGVLIAAYVIWLLDQNHGVCDPHSLVQGHAIWHVLTAVASFMIFAHYRATAHDPVTPR
jgi:predicted membrane channel-forming protein YqfA (hemolysin III family)